MGRDVECDRDRAEVLRRLQVTAGSRARGPRRIGRANDLGTRDITRTVPFWLIFVASTLGGITNSASTALIPTYVENVLGGGSALAGGIIAVAAVSSMLAMPMAGLLADRRGYRLVALVGSAIASGGLIFIGVVPAVWAAIGGRLFFGLGSAAAMTLLMAWLLMITPIGQRGKVLSIFGLSVWIGLALGPQIGASVQQIWTVSAVFLVCAGLEAATTVVILFLPRPRAASSAADPVTASTGFRQVLLPAVRAVSVPGVAAAAAWCGEGLLVGFLIIHLAAVGVPAAGLLGAASVFGVFAASVIVARLLLATLPDRIGPLRATAASLVTLTAGLVIIAIAPGFWVAAAGAVLIGVGFSPLYPSLTMLATRGLRSSKRALGIGLFSSFTSVGYGGGALVGGVVIGATSSMWAFLLVAGFQVIALAVVTIFTDDPRPRRHAIGAEYRDPAA
ncbi:MFS transporter [Microbacterium rhizomatis]|uniref:MFS transporter n=1 Tax=Microbacterium rhizomatis TaxID=1631477 RepID=A0A5J5J1R4_9MICO|nr:MFS transporter [Microbacterium rhizomatis]KAA9106037.1 MFS transporter [Microbacterium rhizomatis]